MLLKCLSVQPKPFPIFVRSQPSLNRIRGPGISPRLRLEVARVATWICAKDGIKGRSAAPISPAILRFPPPDREAPAGTVACPLRLVLNRLIRAAKLLALVVIYYMKNVTNSRPTMFAITLLDRFSGALAYIFAVAQDGDPFAMRRSSCHC